MKKDKINCFILHTNPFKETSLLLRVFSKEYGRLSLVAKGVKRKNSQGLRAILQPFNLLAIDYVGKGELKTFCDAEVIKAWHSKSNRVLACGYYLNELVIRALQEWQETEDLFDFFQQSLEKLQSLKEESNQELAVILRNFEVSLLTQLGIAPDWYNDIQEKEIVAESHYHFINDQGFVESTNETDQTLNNSMAWSGEAILSLAKGVYSLETLPACKRITQELLLPVIGDKPFVSRKMWL